MHGHQVIRDNRFKSKVHTKRMHLIFYGFSMMEALISIVVMSLFLIPLSQMTFNQSDLDRRIAFKVGLYQHEVSCVDNILHIDNQVQVFRCEVLDGGYKIIYDEYAMYYVQP